MATCTTCSQWTVITSLPESDTTYAFLLVPELKTFEFSALLWDYPQDKNFISICCRCLRFPRTCSFPFLTMDHLKHLLKYSGQEEKVRDIWKI